MPNRPIKELAELSDSKKLTPRQRERLFPLIKDKAVDWSVVHIGAGDIDKRGIQHANISGMRRAVARLEARPGYVLTDALFIPGLTQPQLPIIGGDAAARCIAAASVLAKVSRDHLMRDLDARYPGYELAKHKGYGTKAHEAAISALGACPEHRMSYDNVRRAHAEFAARA